MGNMNIPPAPDSEDSAPKGAEVVLANEAKPPAGIEPELLERMVEEATRKVVIAVKHEMHSGPMPPPKQLKEYDQVLPGTAVAIRDEFLANGQHVRAMETRALEAEIQDNEQNRRVAAGLVLLAFGLVVLLALTGHDWVAGLVAVSTVAAVITGFLRRVPDRPAKSGTAAEEEP